MPVKRYRVRCKDGIVTICPHGAWVDYNDYDALAARLAALQDWAHTESLNTVRLNARLAEAERLLFALRDGIAVADFGDWNLLDQVDSFRSGDSASGGAE